MLYNEVSVREPKAIVGRIITVWHKSMKNIKHILNYAYKIIFCHCFLSILSVIYISFSVSSFVLHTPLSPVRGTLDFLFPSFTEPMSYYLPPVSNC